MIFALDGAVLLNHYVACYDSARSSADAATDPIERARHEGAADAFRALYHGLKAAAEKAGIRVKVQIKAAVQ